MKKYNSVDIEVIKAADVVSTSATVESEKIFFGENNAAQSCALDADSFEL